MARSTLHTTDMILDAARTLVLDEGARAATMNRIVAVSGAPKGSIYHRFATLNDLLAAMWIRAVQRSQEHARSAALDGADPVDAAVAAGMAVFDFAATCPADARLLVSFRQQDLIRPVTHPALLESLLTLNDPTRDVVSELARRLSGRASKAVGEQVTLAIVDLPIGAVRRHLISGSPFPPTLRPQLEAAIRAALDSVKS